VQQGQEQQREELVVGYVVVELEELGWQNSVVVWKEETLGIVSKEIRYQHEDDYFHVRIFELLLRAIGKDPVVPD